MSAPVDVILVDADDQEIGRCEKLEAHRQGLLHRAVSVFVVNDAGEWLLQQRAEGKYHSGGLWSNAACTHPRPGETLAAAVGRAVAEELGTSLGTLAWAFPFHYRADVGSGLVEHEYDHVFVGRLRGDARPVPGEVSAITWSAPDVLTADVARAPDRFTPWFRLLVSPVMAHLGAAR